MPVARRPFVEVADRVLVARYPQWDVNVGLVVGALEALVVDTRSSTVEGHEVGADVVRLGLAVPVTTVVNTYVHVDHTVGNGAFGPAAVHAHTRVAETFQADAQRRTGRFEAEPGASPELGDTEQDVQDLLATTPRGPDVTFSSTARIELGDRSVELVHTGRGPTDGDIAMRVPDAGVTFLGDLVEQSAHPALFGDSFPLEWATTLDGHLAGLPGDVVVPGHGTVVDPGFVRGQRDEMAAHR